MKSILALILLISSFSAFSQSLGLTAQLRKKLITIEEFAEQIDNNKAGYFCQSESQFKPQFFNLYSNPMVVGTNLEKTELPWNTRQSSLTYNDLRMAKKLKITESKNKLVLTESEKDLETVWTFEFSNDGQLLKMKATTKDNGVLVAKDVCKA